MLVTMSGAVMLTFWIRSGEELRFFNTKSCSTVAPDRVASKWKRGSFTVAFGPSEADTTAISPMLSKTTPATRIIGCWLGLGAARRDIPGGHSKRFTEDRNGAGRASSQSYRTAKRKDCTWY